MLLRLARRWTVLYCLSLAHIRQAYKESVHWSYTIRYTLWKSISPKPLCVHLVIIFTPSPVRLSLPTTSYPNSTLIASIMVSIGEVSWYSSFSLVHIPCHSVRSIFSHPISLSHLLYITTTNYSHSTHSNSPPMNSIGEITWYSFFSLVHIPYHSVRSIFSHPISPSHLLYITTTNYSHSTHSNSPPMNSIG